MPDIERPPATPEPPTDTTQGTRPGWRLAIAAALNRIRGLLTGGPGAEATAAALAELEPDGFRILRDRAARGGGTGIDHVVVGPPGVFVVATRNYRGAVSVRGGDVYVGGWPRRAVDGIIEQAEAVGDLLATAGEDVPVTPMLVIHRAQLPLLGASARDVRIVNSRGLTAFFKRTPPIMDGAEVDRLTALLDAALPPAR